MVEPRRSEWIKAVRRENWIPSKHAVLCSAHFEEKMIDRSMKRIILAKTAIPTIFSAFPKHLQKVSCSFFYLLCTTSKSCMYFFLAEKSIIIYVHNIYQEMVMRHEDIFCFYCLFTDWKLVFLILNKAVFSLGHLRVQHSTLF